MSSASSPAPTPRRRRKSSIFSAHYDHVGVDEKGRDLQRLRRQRLGHQRPPGDRRGVRRRPQGPPEASRSSGSRARKKGLLGSKWFSDHVSLPGRLQDRRRHQHRHGQPERRQVDRPDPIGEAPQSLEPRHLPRSRPTPKGWRSSTTPTSTSAGPTAPTSPGRASRSSSSSAGMHEDYHKSTDDVDKADFDKAARSPEPPIGSDGWSPRPRTFPEEGQGRLTPKHGKGSRYDRLPELSSVFRPESVVISQPFLR